MVTARFKHIESGDCQTALFFALIVYQKALWSFWDDEEKQKGLWPKMKLSLNLQAISYSVFEMCW